MLLEEDYFEYSYNYREQRAETNDSLPELRF